MQILLKQFVSSFQKAITVEMEAMRQRSGPFEVPLINGRAVDSGEDGRGKFYTFKIVRPNDKLVLQAECTLRYDVDELLVTITDIGQDEVTIRSEQNIGLSYSTYTLIIYPWFLYEKLKLALATLLESEQFFALNSLLLFGKGVPYQQPQPLQTEHPELNASQLKAVQLCSDSNLAFVWGPPGTGKTTTLGHIVTELLAQGHRILITSTTNAAVDQALAKLAKLPGMQKRFERGQVVRIGQTSVETFEASLGQVVKRLNAETQTQLEYLRKRRQEVRGQIEQCVFVSESLRAQVQPVQLDLFSEIKSETISAENLGGIFSDKYIRRILRLPLETQQELIARRQRRLETLLVLYQEKMAQYSSELRRKEATVVQKARVILATMTNVYLSTLLNAERFDIVIVEEAGMAILPTLFYCAALARKKVIMVGDPQQLPPIVQSSDEYVYKAMGRNIFEVTTQNPHYAETVVMLDIQYRMHPVIGNLVSNLFYEGKLHHGENTAERGNIAEKKPYPGAPLVVVDTQHQTSCATHEGSFSRFNERTAQFCSDLAVEAVRSGVESVAIITPYVAQSRLIRQQLSRFRKEAQQVECQTVHRFQGGERDVVIFDTVDAPPLLPGVLLSDRSFTSSSKNLVNVSISRARGKLIIVSDVAYFSHNSPESIINQMLYRAISAGLRVSLDRVE
jgi:superfamily I DNA and/or RNA helicase